MTKNFHRKIINYLIKMKKNRNYNNPIFLMELMDYRFIEYVKKLNKEEHISIAKILFENECFPYLFINSQNIVENLDDELLKNYSNEKMIID